jgi:hypothetical protein
MEGAQDPPAAVDARICAQDHLQDQVCLLMWWLVLLLL